MYQHFTKEENETLTRVGPGTPMGELLRRYWWPVSFSNDLKDKPTLIRLLGEDLVLYRERDGSLGVMDSKCPHRRANLCLGHINPKGLRCRYHGWLFDKEGTLLETPGEPEGSKLKDKIKQTAYLAQELGGVIFAYMGPQPAPLLPRYHILVSEGERRSYIQSFNDCNFLQCVENGIDPFHVSFLHADVWADMSHAPEKVWFEEMETGCIYKAVRNGRKPGEFNYRDHPVVMPGIVFGGDGNVSFGGEPEKGALPAASARWSVPIDDTHTMNMRVFFRPSGQKQTRNELRKDPGKATPIQPYGEYRSGTHELGYSMASEIAEEDATVLDSIGPISDRENENLSLIDGGIIMLRNMFLQEVEAVKAGRDPKGTVRDAKENELLIVRGTYRWISADEREKIPEAV